MPVPDVAAVDADDDRFLRDRLVIIRIAFQANRLLAAKISFMTGSDLLCRWRRMVQALAVLPIGSTSFSNWAVKPKETSEAHLVSRYSSSGAVRSVNSSPSGLKVWLAVGWQRQR